jgi:outer membrane lipoprotein-sorting protein
MKRIAWYLSPLTLLACIAAQDGGNPAEKRVRAAIEKTRNQKSYNVEFEVVIRVPDSDPMKLKGQTVWVNPGVLFTQYTASGGDEIRIVRVGEKVWMYHVLAEDWVKAEDAGRPGAGRGVQNPDEILSAIVKAADQAKAVTGDAIEMKLDGAIIQKVMREQAMAGGIDWAQSNGTVRMSIGPDDLMYAVKVDAQVASTDRALNGRKIGYAADVRLKSYNREFAVEFSTMDLKTKKTTCLPMPPFILDEIEKVKGVPDELRAEVKKLRPK